MGREDAPSCWRYWGWEREVSSLRVTSKDKQRREIFRGWGGGRIVRYIAR